MRTEEMYHRQQEVWIYNMLEPDNERMYVGRKEPKPTPAWAIPFPSHMIKNAPPELTDLQREEREDLYLMSKGIK